LYQWQLQFQLAVVNEVVVDPVGSTTGASGPSDLGQQLQRAVVDLAR
jgi:hypothetical protein